MKRLDPIWELPAGLESPNLCLYNSLTRKKEKFIPKKEIVTWYSCGPTTYDDAHMGHARSYISFDILRRVLQDYFGYPLMFVMNITDVDDKIIKRARMKHLFEQYKQSTPQEAQLLDDLSSAFMEHEKSIASTEDADKRRMLVEDVEKVKNAVNTLKDVKAFSDVEGVKKALESVLATAEPVLGEWLDKAKGHEVTDNSIFTDLPRHYEQEFNRDMDALNVLMADVVTRVSEHVPQIVSFVQQVIYNGYAYEANRSVYFDVAEFDEHPNHYYAKLVPEAYGNQGALEEGEGVLSLDRASEKRSSNDFALWKASKPGEPWWESPWGKGRPGWHIECSAMAVEILGESLDIHTGGVDLKFPHHDNEIAQTEAYFGCRQWVNYFLHTGHLHIEGCKMSKSLKNFVSIREALRQYSPALLRTAFLLHSWKDTLDYSINTMEGAKQYLKMVTEFALNVEDLIRRCGASPTIWTETERKLNATYNQARVSVHKALCDNVDTRSALDAMRDLVSDANKYMSTSTQVNSQLLTNIKNYIHRLFNVFGVNLRQTEGDSRGDDRVVAIAGVVGEVREALRALARGREADVGSMRARQMALCDRIRDDLLPPLGIRLEDRDRGAPTIKLVNAEDLMKELEEKKAAEAAKKVQKEKQKAEAASNKRQDEPVANPQEMFRTAEYSAWSENGLPTHDKEGKEVTKSQLKKLTRMMEAQKKKFEKWKSQQAT